MKESCEYTIIIPHYKSLDLLSRCLQTIPSREDIQVIVVDDNSGIDKDKFYEQNLSENVTFIFLNENKGAGHARNVGLQHASGRWLLFADADDYFLQEAFVVFNQYKDSDFDIIYFGIRSVDSNTGRPTMRYMTYNSYIDNCEDNIVASIDKLKCRHDVPWGKMIRRSMVTSNMIFFDETKYCNDTMFSTKCALAAKSIYVDKRPCYCVTSCPGSLTTHVTLESYRIRYQVILRKNMLLRDSGYSKYQLSIVYYLLKFLKFGLSPFFDAIRLGFRYRANFFVGSSQWGKKSLKKLLAKNEYSINLKRISQRG